MKRKWRSAGWLAIGVLILGAMVYRAGPAGTARALLLAAGRPWLVAGAVAFFGATLAGFLVKWHVICRAAGANLAFRQSLGLFGTLCLVGTFTPGRAGELAVVLLARSGGRLTGVALVNRLLESLVTLLAGVVALLCIFADDPNIGRFWVVAPLALVFVAALVVLSRRRLVERVLGAVRACLRPFSRFRAVAWLMGLEERHAAGIERFHAANARLLRPGPVAVFAVLMLAIWAMMVSANYLLVTAMVPPGDSPIAYGEVFAVMVASALVMLISPIPGGVGLTELTAVELFAYLGHDQPQLVSFLILARVMLYAGVVGLYLVGRAAGRPLPETPAETG